MAEIRVKETGTIKLFESDNTSNVTIAAPASLGADRTITLPDASVTLASGTMLATDGSGASLTALNASELGSGTVPTARLGSGTASSSTVLYGDQTYKAEPGGGKILQVVNYSGTDYSSTDSTSYVATAATVDITPSATSSKIFWTWQGQIGFDATANFYLKVAMFRDATNVDTAPGTQSLYSSTTADLYIGCGGCGLDSPSSTSALTYELYYYTSIGDSSHTAKWNPNHIQTQITLMEVGV